MRKSAKSSARKISVTATATPAQTGIATLVAATAPSTATPTADTTYRGMQRDAKTISAARTNFAVYSDRDTAYLAFFGSVMRLSGDVATLLQLHNAGTIRTGDTSDKRYNPRYIGSAKATDAGAINRLILAGFMRYSPDKLSLHATARATGDKTLPADNPGHYANSAYAGTKAAPATK